MRKTKIVCTVGPSTDKDGVLEQLMLSGMNVARFNFSHGDFEIHKRRFEQIVEIRERLGLPVATMLDTKGTEIRMGKFKDGKKVTNHSGDKYTLTVDDCECDEHKSSVSFKHLVQDVSVGTRILINDGLISMTVEKISGNDIHCRVTDGGVLSDCKGVNVPGVKLSMPYLSERDMADLEFGAKMGFDFIAASFVRSAADGIMVARGDMGVEIPFEQIPSIQKSLIRKGYTAGKQVITATQMLESMITNPRPTRAEITDVANAIYDGTSAIMLSGETAAGENPVKVVQTMALIAETTEEHIDYITHFKRAAAFSGNGITDAISHATVTTAHDLGAKAIITVTKSGSTARMISKHRPKCMIISCTTDERVWRQTNLSWGVAPLMCEEKNNTDELFTHAVEIARKNGLVEKGDTVVITAGIPLGVSGTTNMLRVDKLK